MSNNSIVLIGSINMALAVALGAFGAHALEPILETNNRVNTFETASLYHFIHSFGIIILALLPLKKKTTVVITMVLGIFFFSGSLYVLSITNMTTLGAMAPIGGSAFIVSWIMLAYKCFKSEAF